MKFNLVLSNAKVFDAKNFEIVSGQKFKLVIEDLNIPQGLQWFLSNDPVLDSKPVADGLEATAMAEGDSYILVMDSQFAILDKLFVRVVASIDPPVLTVTAGKPVLK